MSWDKSRPSGSAAIKSSDELLRDNFAGIEEGLVPYDYLRLEVQGSAPVAITDRFLIYGKDFASKTQLYGIDEDGNEIQFTEGGNIIWKAKAATDITMKLGDTAGANRLSVTDSAGVLRSSIDSDGNINGNSLEVGTHVYDQIWSQTLADNAGLDLGVISGYEGATFLYNGWRDGVSSEDGSCIFGTGDAGATLRLSQVGKVNCSNTINWASQPTGTVNIGREAAGNKLSVVNKTGFTINVRVVRIG